MMRKWLRLTAGAAAGALIAAAGGGAMAAAPEAQGHDYVVRDFHFRSGETLPELKLHYYTLGTPKKDAAGHVVNGVLILHGTGGSGRQFAQPQFADVLFTPGGLLDPAKYFIIMPDGIGHGGSSKPSDGLRMKFPKYDYDDMVAAQHALTHDGLGIERLRLVMGTSMGCMHSFVWAETYPDGAKAFMPLACLPIEIAGRNRLWRALAGNAIKSDPAWAGGEYRTPPKMGLTAAEDLLIVAGAAPWPMQLAMPTRAQVDPYAASEPERRAATIDANDTLYALEASRSYDPSKGLEKITAPLTWVNSADDFINPPELPVAKEAIKRIKGGRFVLIPAGPDTHGHGTHTWAVFWKDDLAALLTRSE
jgi:homoserine O-acetyltransferase